MTELSISSAQLLSAVAVLLLVFVSGGVIYLSTIEWRDRRRRKAQETPSGRRSSAGKGAPTSVQAKRSTPKRPLAKPGNP